MSKIKVMWKTDPLYSNRLILQTLQSNKIVGSIFRDGCPESCNYVLMLDGTIFDRSHSVIFLKDMSRNYLTIFSKYELIKSKFDLLL